MCTPKLDGSTACAASAADQVQFGPGLTLTGVRMKFSRNEEIFGEGEEADFVYKVVSGSVRTMRFTQDGRRQILGFHLCCDIFGLEWGEKHSLTAEAISDVEVIMVRRRLLEKAADENPVAARSLLNLAAHELDESRAHALVLGRKSAGERVAAFLLRFSQRLAMCQELDLPMSRADIADYLSLTIETVSRTFTEMERLRAIDLPSSRRVIMRDRMALTQLEAA